MLRVRVDGGSDPLVERCFAIFKDRVERRCNEKVVQVSRGEQVRFRVDPGLRAEAFRIEDVRGVIQVAGGSSRGLLYGVGKFLRTSRYENGFMASGWRGVSEPRGSLRGMYFASHFHNWYQQAPEGELVRYVEDLALWGVNAVKVIYPMINLGGWEDPEAVHAMAKLCRYAQTAKDLGLQFATGLNNTLFSGAPKAIRATPLPDPTHRRGNSGHPICPSNPEGRAYILENSRRLMEGLSGVGLDILVFWPYDEGGCACPRCEPWGRNGYLRISQDLAALGRRYFPGLKTVLSTWMFDTPPEGEWAGLAEALRTNGGWVDYVLADSHEDFPRYPLDVGVPGGRPLLNFPEISMWGNWPWGGVGANPLPSRLQRLWDQVKGAVSGGFPYSEGIYEDMNKAVVLQYYWNPGVSARETLMEYIGYEFGVGVTGEVLELVAWLESSAGQSYRKQRVDGSGVERALQLADRVQSRLPGWARSGWRWEILYLRAVLDRERFVGGGLGTSAAEAAMARLIELYHCELETDDPYHHRVRPPLRRAVSRRGTL